MMPLIGISQPVIDHFDSNGEYVVRSINVNDPRDRQEEVDDKLFLYNSNYLETNKLHEFFAFKHQSINSCLNFLYLNCRSLSKHFSEVQDLLHIVNGSLSLVALTETWLTPENEMHFQLPSHSFVANSRVEKIGGGVGIFVNNSLLFTERHDLNRMHPYLECVFIEIVQVDRCNIIFGVLYKPPNADINMFNTELLSLLKQIDCSKRKGVILAGDFNLDLLKADTHIPTGDFINSMLSYSFLPTVNIPTRITEHSATIIDNVFINKDFSNFKSAVICSDISDHLPIAVHLDFNPPKPKPLKETKKRLFDTKSIENFNQDLKNSLHWSSVYAKVQEGDAEGSYVNFYNRFRQIFDLNFPKKSQS